MDADFFVTAKTVKTANSMFLDAVSTVSAVLSLKAV